MAQLPVLHDGLWKEQSSGLRQPMQTPASPSQNGYGPPIAAARIVPAGAIVVIQAVLAVTRKRIAIELVAWIDTISKDGSWDATVDAVLVGAGGDARPVGASVLALVATIALGGVAATTASTTHLQTREGLGVTAIRVSHAGRGCVRTGRSRAGRTVLVDGTLDTVPSGHVAHGIVEAQSADGAIGIAGTGGDAYAPYDRLGVRVDDGIGGPRFADETRQALVDGAAPAYSGIPTVTAQARGHIERTIPVIRAGALTARALFGERTIRIARAGIALVVLTSRRPVWTIGCLSALDAVSTSVTNGVGGGAVGVI